MSTENIDGSLAKASRVWGRVVARRPLPWYAEEKALAGAYAALVGLDLRPNADANCGGWSALACGDSCLFHLRQDTVIGSFPISRAEEFSNGPLLLGSRLETRGVEALRTAAGTWLEEDCFYLMSDALACWFLTSCEAGVVPWRQLRDITVAKEPSFEDWISSLRRKRAIKNDDCTLVAVTPEHC